MNDHRVMCAEMNCDWVGECPAVAACPLCGSRQLRLEPIRWIEHPEFGTVPICGGRVLAEFVAEAREMGIEVPEVLA